MIIFIQARGFGIEGLWIKSRWRWISVKSSGAEFEAEPKQKVEAQRKGSAFPHITAAEPRIKTGGLQNITVQTPGIGGQKSIYNHLGPINDKWSMVISVQL